MTYLILFLEGILTFISPCLLPMLPIYISYFAGQNAHQGSQWAVLRNALGFVLGFTLVFVTMGAFAGAIGGLLVRYRNMVNLVAGGIIVLFGLNYLGVLKVGFLNKIRTMDARPRQPGFISSVLFGLIFSIGWTPCVGAFLGSALMMAASSGQSSQGILMLLAYSLGLGIPFVASALLVDRLKSTFDLIKKHYRAVNLVAGSFLVILGIAMASGLLGQILERLAN